MNGDRTLLWLFSMALFAFAAISLAQEHSFSAWCMTITGLVAGAAAGHGKEDRK